MCDEALVAFRAAGVAQKDIGALHERFHEANLTLEEALRLYPQADTYRRVYGTTLMTAFRYMSLWAVRWRGQGKD